MKKIRVFPAAEFVCEECGKNNLFSLVGSEVADEVLESTKKELLKEFGLGTMQGCFVMQPVEVECHHCKTKFEVEF
jgi:hypothetical protein